MLTQAKSVISATLTAQIAATKSCLNRFEVSVEQIRSLYLDVFIEFLFFQTNIQEAARIAEIFLWFRR